MSRHLNGGIPFRHRICPFKVLLIVFKLKQHLRFFPFVFQSKIGKTLLAKAVANQTSATFLRVVGSELIQKYLGDGPKLVRELFRVAEEHAPSIVFIDEIDAIGTKRYFFFF